MAQTLATMSDVKNTQDRESAGARTHYPDPIALGGQDDRRAGVEFSFVITDDPFTVAKCLSLVAGLNATPEKFQVVRREETQAEVFLKISPTMQSARVERLVSKIKMLTGFIRQISLK